ncbi:MAG TPA: hypothetical protein VFW11_13055 [Cyclobacteriaceae bacterium]|nr:hypothetical protein [Cyclobacteriaceae bacterium]
MNKTLPYAFSFIMIMCGGVVNAQQIKRFAPAEKKKTPEENMALGNQLYNTGEYYGAAKLYQEVLNEQNDNGAALFQLANTQRLLRNYHDAESLYYKIVTEKKKDYPEASYWYGVTLESQGRYNDALNQFETSVEAKDVTADMIRRKIISNKFALNTAAADDKITVALMNYDQPAFGARAMPGNTVLFTGVEQKLIRRKVQLEDVKGIYDTVYTNTLFQGTVTNGSLVEPIPLKLRMRDEVMSGGGASLTEDNNKMYFSICKSLEGNSHCDIYSSNKRKDGSWGDPTMMSATINLPGYSSKHPMVMTEGSETCMFYSSDRPGGSGGYDIWYTKMESNGTFGQSINLGKAINTFGEEATPYYDTASHALFFSSNGHQGLGGLDVYLVQLDKTFHNGSLVHLGKPINSSADDYYFSVFDQGRKGFLSSNRGAPYDKIYAVNFKETFSYKKLNESMAELKTFDEADSDFPLFKESFAYRALAVNGEDASLLEGDDITISGTLFSQGQSGSNKTVMLVDGEGNILETTTADENGFFEFKKLPADQNYSLMFQEKDAPINFTADYKNSAGEIFKAVSSTEDPSSFRYRNLSSNEAGMTALDAGDGNLSFPEGNPESLFTPAMTYTAYEEIENNFFDRLEDKINLRVQVGAYRRPSPELFKDLKLANPIERVRIDGVTKFLSGNFKKLKEAEEQRKSAFDQGVLDAFIAVYFNGKRIAILMY